MCVHLIIIFVCTSVHTRVQTWWPWGCPRHCLASVWGCVVTWRAEMDGLIPIYERHPPIGHTPIGRIWDVPIGYQSDWLGPLLKGSAQARFWGRRPEATETTRPGRRPGTRETTRPPEPPPRTSSPPSPVDPPPHTHTKRKPTESPDPVDCMLNFVCISFRTHPEGPVSLTPSTGAMTMTKILTGLVVRHLIPSRQCLKFKR